MKRIALTGSILLALCTLLNAQDIPERMAVLDLRKGHWRRWVTYKTPVVMEKDGSVRPLRAQRHFWMSGENMKGGPAPVIESTHPPDSWSDVDFDDNDWAQGYGSLGPRYNERKSLWGSKRPNPTPMEALAVFARGRFRVEDPAGIKDLQLNVTYRGGLVAYLNGKEIGRRHMPKAPITAETLAEAYPDDVYLDDKGKQIAGAMTSRTPDKMKATYRKRDRRAEFRVPADALRKGVNVLALHVHRAPPKTIWATPKDYKGTTYLVWPPPWGHARLMGGVLSCEPGSAVVPNLARPEGAQAWATPATIRKTRLTPGTWHDPLETHRPVTVTGCRNGSFCGKVLVTSPSAIENLHAELKELRGPKGRIPAKNVRLQFGVADDRVYRKPAAFGTLLPTPPATVPVDDRAKAAILPVWIKVSVPEDAGPGAYSGELELQWKDAEKRRIPVTLTVHDWRMPDPKQFHIFVDMIQSPETVAIRYETGQWTEPHWKQLEKCLRLFGECGNKTTYLKLITKTHFGNTQSIVRFVPKGDGGKDGGGWRRDYSILDRYMDILEACQGKPELVILYCWERYTAQNKAPRVTVVDPKTGALSEMETPAYCTPEGKAFWKPVFEELRERFKKRGLENALAIGAFGDFNKPKKEHVEFFKEIAPGLQWVAQGHPYHKDVHGVPCRYTAFVWGVHAPPDPAAGRRYGWQAGRGDRVVAQFARDLWRNQALSPYRTMLEWNMAAGRRGAGRIGGDFWSVLGRDQKSNRGGYSGGGRLAHRFPEMGKWGQLVVRQQMINPGPDGALPCVMYEAFREGAQDCEARMFIERALLSKELPPELATRARRALDERTRFLLGWGPYDMGYRRRQEELYSLAAAVQAALRTTAE